MKATLKFSFFPKHILEAMTVFDIEYIVQGVCMAVPRFSALIFTLSCLLCVTTVSAGTNPFKKTKDYQFADSIAWYFKDGAAIKSGSAPDGGDTLFYHLNINKSQLRLRLAKNDPSGELVNTRAFDDLAIVDVLLDGKRLSRFQWCLDNQATIAATLKQNSVVVNGICTNAGGGDFTVMLDDDSRDRILRSQNIEFVIVPYGRPIRLQYTMNGFAKGYGAIVAPPPPPPPSPSPPVVVVAPKVEPKSEPKSEPRPAVVKTCYVEAPDEFQGAVQSIAYVCDDKTKKATAEATVQTQVAVERKKRKDAEADRKRTETERLQEEKAFKSVETEWDKRQVEIWVERCEKHWAKGQSPCYCSAYLGHAPDGVVSTCDK